MYSSIGFALGLERCKIEQLWNFGKMICKGCNIVNPLDKQYNQTFSRGNLSNPKFFFVGEAPGSIFIRRAENLSNEDKILQMFFSREKTLRRAFNYTKTSYILKRALFYADIMEQSYITNLMKCPNFENKLVTQEQFGSCFKFFENEMKLLKPKQVFVLGNNVYNYFKRRGIECIKIKHPAFYVYKQEEEKKAALMVADEIKQSMGEEKYDVSLRKFS